VKPNLIYLIKYAGLSVAENGRRFEGEGAYTCIQFDLYDFHFFFPEVRTLSASARSTDATPMPVSSPVETSAQADPIQVMEQENETGSEVTASTTATAVGPSTEAAVTVAPPQQEAVTTTSIRTTAVGTDRVMAITLTPTYQEATAADGIAAPPIPSVGVPSTPASYTR